MDSCWVCLHLITSGFRLRMERGILSEVAWSPESICNIWEQFMASVLLGAHRLILGVDFPPFLWSRVKIWKVRNTSICSRVSIFLCYWDVIGNVLLTLEACMMLACFQTDWSTLWCVMPLHVLKVFVDLVNTCGVCLIKVCCTAWSICLTDKKV